MGLSPADALRRWLSEHDGTIDDLARHSRLDAGELKGILAGTTPVTTTRADRLQRGTGIRAAVWRGLQDDVDAAAPIRDRHVLDTSVHHERWSGVLAVLDEDTIGARRLCTPASGIRTASMPLPLTAGRMQIGVVDRLIADDTRVMGLGWLVLEALRAAGSLALRDLADVLLGGGEVPTAIQVDETLTTELLSEESGVVTVCEDWRLRSVALTADEPAWPQARISLARPQGELW